MMTNNEKHTSGGIGFIGLLTIVFITLKLTHRHQLELALGAVANLDWIIHVIGNYGYCTAYYLD